MKTFGSCHLTIDRAPRMIVCFMNVDFFQSGGTSTPFLNGFNPQTLPFILTITLIMGELVFNL